MSQRSRARDPEFYFWLHPLKIDINHYRDGLFEWWQLLNAPLAILFVGFYVHYLPLQSAVEIEPSE